jgi:uncharacterized phiE125 gp8 family phage protein
MTDFSPYFGGRGWPIFNQFLDQRSLRVITPAAEEHFTIEQCRSHLRLDTYGSPEGHPDDDMIMGLYLPMARSICEMISGRAFVPQVFEVGLGQFPCSGIAFNRNGVSLGMGPVRGVQSVIYYDGTADVTMDATGYIVDPYTDGGYVYAAYGTMWPSLNPRPNGVRVRFGAGFDVAGASPYEFVMPETYKWAMLLALGHVYENRENTTTLDLKEIPMGIKALLGPSSLVNNFA